MYPDKIIEIQKATNKHILGSPFSWYTLLITYLPYINYPWLKFLTTRNNLEYKVSIIYAMVQWLFRREVYGMHKSWVHVPHPGNTDHWNSKSNIISIFLGHIFLDLLIYSYRVFCCYCFAFCEPLVLILYYLLIKRTSKVITHSNITNNS